MLLVWRTYRFEVFMEDYREYFYLISHFVACTDCIESLQIAMS